jgi:hypothetical protein
MSTNSSEHQQQQFRLTHALTYRRQDKQAGISPPLTISGNLGPPVIDQLALARLLASGAYDRQLRLLRRRYRARRDALTAAATMVWPWRMSRPFGPAAAGRRRWCSATPDYLSIASPKPSSSWPTRPQRADPTFPRRPGGMMR